MANRNIKDSWSKIKPDDATHERILNNILDRKHSGETKKGKVYDMAIKQFRILAPIAACLIVALAISIPILLNNGGGSPLPNPISNGGGSHLPNPINSGGSSPLPNPINNGGGSIAALAPSEQSGSATEDTSFVPRQTEAPNLPSTDAAQFNSGGSSIATLTPSKQPGSSTEDTPFVPRQTEASNLPSTDAAQLSAININELPEITAARLVIDLRPEDFVPMSKDEIIDFYGCDFFPSAIPADMKIVEEGEYGIYKRDEGAGEVYYSANLAWYVDDNVNRQLQVNIDKGKLPDSCFAYLGVEYETSVINGAELLIGRSVGHFGAERFVAEMMYAGNGLRIESSYLTQAEFVDAVTSLIGGLDEAAQTAGSETDGKNAEVVNPAYQDEQIPKVTSEQVRKVTDDMKFDDIIALLGETANVGFGRPILQYEVDGDYLLNIAFISLETPLGYYVG